MAIEVGAWVTVRRRYVGDQLAGVTGQVQALLRDGDRLVLKLNNQAVIQPKRGEPYRTRVVEVDRLDVSEVEVLVRRRAAGTAQ